MEDTYGDENCVEEVLGVEEENAMKNGIYVATPHGKTRKDGKARKGAKYLRITAGPQRGRYVHDLIAEARMGRLLENDETVEHIDGNGLNVEPDNLIVVTKAVNTRLRHLRDKRARAKEIGQGEISWEGLEDGTAPF